MVKFIALVSEVINNTDELQINIWSHISSTVKLWHTSHTRKLSTFCLRPKNPINANCVYCVLVINAIRHRKQFLTKGLWKHDLLCRFVMHYDDVIMSAMASQITSLANVYSSVYSCADQRKHQSSASLVFVRGIRRWLANSSHQGSVMRKCFHLMTCTFNLEPIASHSVFFIISGGDLEFYFVSHCPVFQSSTCITQPVRL